MVGAFWMEERHTCRFALGSGGSKSKRFELVESPGWLRRNRPPFAGPKITVG